MQRAQRIGSLSLTSACNVILMCMVDLKHVERVSRQLASNARFQALYLRCVSVLYKVRSERTWTVATPIAAENSGVLTSAVEDLLSLSYRLEHVFLGLGSHDCASVKLVCMFFMVVCLCLRNSYLVQSFYSWVKRK